MRFLTIAAVFLFAIPSASCSSKFDDHSTNRVAPPELRLLGGSGHPGMMAFIEISAGTVEWIPIKVEGYFKALETVGGRLYGIVLDVTQKDSPQNGLYEIGRDLTATRVVLEGEPQESSVMAIASGNDVLFVLTEQSIFRLRGSERTARRIAVARPLVPGYSFELVGNSLIYISSESELVEFNLVSQRTTKWPPSCSADKDQSRWFIVGSFAESVLLSEYRESYFILGGPSNADSRLITKSAQENRAHGLREDEDSVIMWSNVEYPSASVRIWTKKTGGVTTVNGLNVTDLLRAPGWFSP